MNIGDLVSVHTGPCPELEDIKPSEWFAVAVRNSTPLIFMGWVEKPGRSILDEGWANLMYPDGTIKIVHCDYFVRVSGNNHKDIGD